MPNRLVNSALAIAICAGPVFAVIQRTPPLKDVIVAESSIFVARVESVDQNAATVSVLVSDEMKGKAPYHHMVVSITGDAEAQKSKQPAQLLERLAPKIEMVIFSSARGVRTTMFAFTNGTWFQMTAQSRADESATVTFTHFEPYLRRTFKGSTPDLKQIVADALSGKKDPPPPELKEPPGIGPPVKK